MTIFRIVGYDGYFYAERVIVVEWQYHTERYILARNVTTGESVLVESHSIWHMTWIPI